MNIGLYRLFIEIDPCTKKWLKDEVLNRSNSMKSVRDEIKKYNNTYPVAIDILKRRCDNIHNDHH